VLHEFNQFAVCGFIHLLSPFPAAPAYAVRLLILGPRLVP
jgi:hypothetical protein